MTAEPAAMFMGMSVGSFRSRYGYLGRREGANVYWATRQLQEVVDAEFGLEPISHGGAAIASPARDTTWDDFN